MEARPLPQRPSLEQYKKQAKDLLKVCKAADPAAIRKWAQTWFDECADDWVAAKAGLRGAEVTAALRGVIEREIVDRIEKSIGAGKVSQAGAKLADAQFFIARGHGFESWSRFAGQIQALQDGNSRGAAFEAAADAIVSGNIGELERLLGKDPGLIAVRSRREHRSTLLHYVAANG